MIIIPAIDLRGGRCVRLTQGRYDEETVYADDPAAVAREWVRQGAQRIHVVDLDGAREGRPVNLGAVRAVCAAAAPVPVQAGGGIRSPADLEAVFAAGARWAILGTRAIQDEAFLREALQRYPGRVLVSLDVRDGRLAVAGWLETAGPALEEAAARLAVLGARQVVVTDVSRDGTLGGVNAGLVAAVAARGLEVIAAGGVSSVEDVARLKALAPRGVAGAIVGKALYAGRLTLPAALEAAREADPEAARANHPDAAPRRTAGAPRRTVGSPAAGSSGAPQPGLARRIIPCLDVKDGRVVKGVGFLDLRDAGDPVELAAAYDAAGADELCFLDISASHEGRRTLLSVVERVAARVFIPLTVGGGIGSVEEIRGVLLAGADKVSINSAAVRDPELIRQGARRFGSQCIVLAIDARRTGPGRWEVYTHGGRRPTGLDAVEWARRGVDLGAGEILLTSMDADGTCAGYDLDLTARVSEAVGVPVIASGGAGDLGHLYQVLTEGKADAALAASIFHYGRHTVGEAKAYLAERGVPVRL